MLLTENALEALLLTEEDFELELFEDEELLLGGPLELEPDEPTEAELLDEDRLPGLLDEELLLGSELELLELFDGELDALLLAFELEEDEEFDDALDDGGELDGELECGLLLPELTLLELPLSGDELDPTVQPGFGTGRCRQTKWNSLVVTVCQGMSATQ